MARRSNNRRPARRTRQQDRAYNPPPDSVAITAAVALGSNYVTYTFDGPIYWNGLTPQILVLDVPPLSVYAATSNTITLLYSNASDGDAYEAPLSDPALRTRGGGYVTATKGFLTS